MIDVQKLTDEGLRNLIKNHQSKRATDQQLYGTAIHEMHRRHGGGLDVEKSVAYLKVAASKRQFVSYGELAEANGAVWDKVRYPMNTHLWALICLARNKNWPMLSAMVVNKQNLATGAMEPDTLAGFVKAAVELGYKIDDPAAFLREQQDACFAWGIS
jgi:hypothetical protein